MNRERWEQIRRMFDHLADKSPSHRADYLGIVCEDDQGLRTEVDRLLAAYDAIEEDESVGIFGASPARAAPRQIRDYEIVRLVGEGGMGAVYEAAHPDHGRVALKLLPAFFVENDTAAKRFENEAAVLGRLDHPALCRLYESFVASGFACIAMELVSGDDLSTLLDAGPLPARRATATIRALADALAAAHAQSVFHRDIKPGNIVVPAGDRASPKLIDFGIAKFADVRLTATGQAVGSPRYMSPEQWLGTGVDGRTDLWSLGVVWYEMVTGRKPFEGRGLADIAAAVMKAEPSPLPARDVAGESLAGCATLIARLLKKDPGERVASCGDLLGMIDAL